MDPPPRWLGPGLHALREELVSFARTAAGVARSPRSFADGWSNGTRAALNPLGYLATSVAFAGPLADLMVGLGGDRPNRPLWVDLLAPLEPYVEYVGLALLCHGLLRLAGSRRPLRATLGVMLYVGGGPAAMVWLASLGVLALRGAAGAWFAAAGAVWAAGVFVAALRGLHQRGAVQTTAVFLLAFALYSAAAGAVGRLFGVETLWSAFGRGIWAGLRTTPTF